MLLKMRVEGSKESWEGGPNLKGRLISMKTREEIYPMNAIAEL